MLIRLSMLLVLVLPLTSLAEEKWKPEAELEAGAVLTGGNSKTETYRLRSDLGYKADKDTYKINGNYIMTKSFGTETAKSWDAGARYERELSEYISTFLGHQAESNIYSGTIQKNNSDVGAKHYIVKNVVTKLFTELGYRYSTEQELLRYQTSHQGRAYIEGSADFKPTLSAKLWFEYVPNFTESQDYQMNFEPSLSFAVSSFFSVKTSYLGKFDNQPGRPGADKFDSIYSMAVVVHVR